uniref:hypothetical protein n=1 Tax=Carnobacterium sp. PL12RED10 TaxID=2592351 RepID=UPI00197A8080
VCQQNVLKSFFAVLYKRCCFDDLNILSLGLSCCQQEFKISFYLIVALNKQLMYINSSLELSQ